MEECTFCKKEKNRVHCLACKHYCKISENNFGICGTRKNIKGKLYNINYAKPSSLAVDPIEKKPLYHFLPGSKTFSLGFFGCNFSCEFCQNYALSCTKGIDLENQLKNKEEILPNRISELFSSSGCKSISFTYNEPAINAEYNIDIMKRMKEKELCDRFVYVTNGYESEEQMRGLKGLLSAANIDLKSFNDEFYKGVCGAKLENVLKTIKSFHEKNIWVEITTLIIPNKNNSKEELSQIASFISSVDKNIPWHVLGFFPMHKMDSHPATNQRDLEEAIGIGKENGLKYVYGGNLPVEVNTHCPKCNSKIIERIPFVSIVGLENGKCSNCGKKVPGVFE